MSVRSIHKHDGSIDGRGFGCRRCRSKRRTRSNSPNSNRHYHLLQRFALSEKQVDLIIKAQGGPCASCGENPAVQVDHDHKTGQVRGILCDGCNGGIALVDEDIALMERAVLYLDGELEF